MTDHPAAPAFPNLAAGRQVELEPKKKPLSLPCLLTGLIRGKLGSSSGNTQTWNRRDRVKQVFKCFCTGRECNWDIYETKKSGKTKETSFRGERTTVH